MVSGVGTAVKFPKGSSSRPWLVGVFLFLAHMAHMENIQPIALINLNQLFILEPKM